MKSASWKTGSLLSRIVKECESRSKSWKELKRRKCGMKEERVEKEVARGAQTPSFYARRCIPPPSSEIVLQLRT